MRLCAWPVPSVQVYAGDVEAQQGPAFLPGAFCSCLAIPHWEAVLARIRASESNGSPVSRLLRLYIIFFKQREMHIF